MRVLLIGCGEVAHVYHLPALKVLAADGTMHITASDLDPARLAATAARFAVETTPDWRRAAANADAVVLTAPPAVNAALAVEALDRGLHVLCEKPPGLTAAEASAMAAAAERAGTVNMIGFNRRFAPVRAKLVERSARLGPPHLFTARFSRAAIGDAPSNTARDWITSDGIHSLDLAIATIGFPERVVVQRRSVGGRLDDAWALQLITPKAIASLVFDFAAGRRHESYEWFGPSFDVSYVFPDHSEWAQVGRESSVVDAASLGATDRATAWGFVDEHRAFVNAIEGRAPRPDCDFAYGQRLMQLVERLLDAAAGDVIELASPGDATLNGRGPAVEASRPEHDRPMARPHRPVVVLHQPAPLQRRFFDPALLSALQARAEVRAYEGEPSLRAADVFVTGRGARPIEPSLPSADDLKLVVVLGASVRAVGPESLLDRGVSLASTADAVAQSVAEHCLMVALAGLRRLTEADRIMHAGGWRSARPPRTPREVAKRIARKLPAPARAALYRQLSARAPALVGPAPAAPPAASDLHGQTVGLIGWGHTAHHLTRLLLPFGCQVLAHSGAIDDRRAAELGVSLVSLGELLARSTVVSLHKGLTPATQGLLGAVELDLIRSGSVLINAARGALIDEHALLARLARGDIVAALDVFVDEPLPAQHPLRGLPNVILTPHNASTTAQEERRMGDQALRTVLDWLDGKPIDLIDRARLDRMT